MAVSVPGREEGATSLQARVFHYKHVGRIPSARRAPGPALTPVFHPSSASRTLEARARAVNGFCKKWMPASRTPWGATTSSVYPDM